MKPRDTRFIEERKLNTGTSYRVTVTHPLTKQRMRKTFDSLAAARAWRDRTLHEGEQAEAGLFPRMTLAQVAAAFFEDMRAGVARTQGGETYQPSVIRAYEASWEQRLEPAFGPRPHLGLRTPDVQDFADRLLHEGLAPQTVHNHVTALRVIYRYAKRRGWCATSPCDAVHLPAGGSKRDRIASVHEASVLLGALEDPRVRLTYALAFYTGLRRGELAALRWSDIDLEKRVLRVERGWDATAKEFVRPKSKAGARAVPIPRVLMPYLLAEDRTEGLVLGVTAVQPLNDSTIKKARRAWANEGLEPIGLHECRHTYATLMIFAGVNIKALQHYMGHSSITVTLDRYGHLLPGNEVEAAALFDDYLERELAKETHDPS